MNISRIYNVAVPATAKETLADIKTPRNVGLNILQVLSGGLTLCQLVPSFSYTLIKAIEYTLSPLNDWLGMFQTIELEKIT